MRKLILLLALFPLLVRGQGTQPSTPALQLTTNSAYLEPSTGLHWYYNGATYQWWAALGVRDSTRYVTPYYANQHYAPIGSGVTSFNGRTGAVVPVTGDYAAFYPLLNGTGATGSWNINSATVTNGVYTTTFNALGDARYVPLGRTLTINGTAFDLSANRSWTVTATTTNALTLGYGFNGQPLSFNGSVATSAIIDTANHIVDKTWANTVIPTATLARINGKEPTQSGTGYVKSAAGVKSYVTAIPNSDLANSSITINGTPISLGGSVTTTGGTVTSFSKTDGWGAVSSVSNPTTTPNYTLRIDTAHTTNGVMTFKNGATKAHLDSVNVANKIIFDNTYLPLAGGTVTGQVKSTAILSGISDGGAFETNGTITAHGNYDFKANMTINYATGGTVGHAAFADNNTLIGSVNIDHNHSFQAYPYFSKTGTINETSMFWSQPAITSGTVTVMNQFYGGDPIKTGGTIGTLTGLRLADMTKGSTNYAIVTEGVAKSSFGGRVGIGTLNPATKLHLYGSSDVNSSITFENSSGPNIWNIKPAIPGVANTGLTINDATSGSDLTRVYISPTGFLGVGYTADPSSGNKVGINGNAFVNGSSTANIFSSAITGNNQVSLNSSGANFGFIMNPSADNWALGYGSNPGVLGTSVLKWNSTGVNIPTLTASQLVATDASKNLVSVTALPSGTTASTQSAGDNSTKVETTAGTLLKIAAAFANPYSTSSTPSIAAGAAAGTSPTITMIGGTNQAMRFSLIPGSGSANGDICTVTLSGGFSYPNKCIAVVTPSVTGGSSLPLYTTVLSNTNTANTFTLNIQGPSLTVGNTYVFDVITSGY